MSNKAKDKVVIVGGGIAGIFTAIQLKRYNIDSVIIEKDEPGGLLPNADHIENLPGFPGGLSGQKLKDKILKQAQDYKIKFIKDEALNISFENGFIIKAKENIYKSEFCVIATGTLPKLPYAEIMQQENVFTDVVPLDGVNGKAIAILGSGDIAFDYALNLSKKNKITLLCRREKFNALPLLIERVKNNPKINIKAGFNLRSADNKNGKVEITGEKGNLSTDYFVIAIGRQGNDKLLAGLDNDNPKLFIAGDCKNGIFRQATIAAADGIRTAMEIYLKMKEDESN